MHQPRRAGGLGVSSADPPWLAAARQRLADYAADYAALAAAALPQTGAGGAPLAALQASLVERYRQFFTPPGLLPVVPAAAHGGAAWLRAQQAQQHYARLALAIASEAGRRLLDALSASGPDAPPLTTLRELHALWIECGEAAWAAAARREEFAGAQAELLAAHAELAAMAGPQ